MIEIKDDDIFQLTASVLSPVQLSQLICVGSASTNTMEGMRGGSESKAIAYYPPGDKKGEGFTQTLAYPAWIARNDPLKIQNLPDINLLYAKQGKIGKVQEKVNKVQTEEEALRATSDKIAGEFTRATYLIQAYNRTSAHITLPFRMDIPLGASVYCELHEDKKTRMKLYGITTGITASLRIGSAPVTQLTLSGIRPGKLVDDEIENPPDIVGFYSERWKGKGVNLYD